MFLISEGNVWGKFGVISQIVGNSIQSQDPAS